MKRSRKLHKRSKKYKVKPFHKKYTRKGGTKSRTKRFSGGTKCNVTKKENNKFIVDCKAAAKLASTTKAPPAAKPAATSTAATSTAATSTAAKPAEAKPAEAAKPAAKLAAKPAAAEAKPTSRKTWLKLFRRTLNEEDASQLNKELKEALGEKSWLSGILHAVQQKKQLPPNLKTLKNLLDRAEKVKDVDKKLVERAKEVVKNLRQQAYSQELENVVKSANAARQGAKRGGKRKRYRQKHTKKLCK